MQAATATPTGQGTAYPTLIDIDVVRVLKVDDPERIDLDDTPDWYDVGERYLLDGLLPESVPLLAEEVADDLDSTLYEYRLATDRTALLTVLWVVIRADVGLVADRVQRAFESELEDRGYYRTSIFGRLRVVLDGVDLEHEVERRFRRGHLRYLRDGEV